MSKNNKGVRIKGGLSKRGKSVRKRVALKSKEEDLYDFWNEGDIWLSMVQSKKDIRYKYDIKPIRRVQ